METVTLAVPESQLIEWVRQLSPRAKQNVLKALVADLDELNSLVDYGSQRIRELCAERGMDWDGLAKEERQRLVDEWLHYLEWQERVFGDAKVDEVYEQAQKHWEESKP